MTDAVREAGSGVGGTQHFNAIFLTGFGALEGVLGRIFTVIKVMTLIGEAKKEK